MELDKRGKGRNILNEIQTGKTEIAIVLTKFTHLHNHPFVLYLHHSYSASKQQPGNNNWARQWTLRSDSYQMFSNKLHKVCNVNRSSQICLVKKIPRVTPHIYSPGTMILDHFKVLFHVIHELHKLVGEVYKAEEVFNISNAQFWKHRLFYSSQKFPLTMLSPWYMLPATGFLPLCFLDPSRKTPHHFNPEPQAACKQPTHLHSLFSFCSIWLFTCFVLTAICPCLLLSVSDTDSVPSQKLYFSTFLYTISRSLIHTANKLNCKMVSWGSPVIAFQINSNGFVTLKNRYTLISLSVFIYIKYVCRYTY